MVVQPDIHYLRNAKQLCEDTKLTHEKPKSHKIPCINFSHLAEAKLRTKNLTTCKAFFIKLTLGLGLAYLVCLAAGDRPFTKVRTVLSHVLQHVHKPYRSTEGAFFND